MFFINTIYMGVSAKVLPLLIKNTGASGTSVFIDKLYLINDTSYNFENTNDVPIVNNKYMHLWYFHLLKTSFYNGDNVVEAYPQFNNVSQVYAAPVYNVPFPYSWTTNYQNSSNFGYKLYHSCRLDRDTNDYLRFHIICSLPNYNSVASSMYPEGGVIQGQHRAKLYINYRLYETGPTHQFCCTLIVQVSINEDGEMDHTLLSDIAEIDTVGMFNIIDLKA